MPGKGKLEYTGKLGDVMKESIKAAKSFIRSKCLDYGVIPPVFEKKDFHIHLPEGATPKDGPSAGIGMVTAIISALTNVSVKRDVAMTGEVTLRGKVLPIGGLKEKLLAALRGGIKTVIIPFENEKDIRDLPESVKKGLKIISVKHVDEVLNIALTKKLDPVEWIDIQGDSKKETTSAISDNQVQH
jgi:ATP-dependent Lon protease